MGLTTSLFSRMFTVFLLVCSLYAVCVGDHAAPSPSHGCYRPCSWPPEPMVCDFHFSVEWFSAMSAQFCGNCPDNSTDCEADNCIALNGVQRPIITVNRRVPGPSIQVCEGDVINVTVQNRLDDHEELTIHWHGIHQVGTPFMDGAPKFTQCPIPFGNSFVYTFNASNPGTHYWHAHSGAQRSDGCAGTLVVRQAPVRDRHSDYYEVDDEAHVLLLQDWFDTVTLTRFIGHHLGGQSNSPDAILINGHGQGKKFQASHDSSPVYTPREILRVVSSRTHRFRLVSNAITNCPLQVSVDNHTLMVVATDGHDVRRARVDAVVLFAGERYDVLLDADQDAGNYWLRVQGLGDCSTRQEVALINYVGTHEHMKPLLPAHSTLTDGVILNPYNELQFSTFKKPVYSLESLVDDTDGVLTADEADVTRYYLPLDFNSVSRYTSEGSHDGHMTSDDMKDTGQAHPEHSHVKRAHGDDEHDTHGGHMQGNDTGAAGGHVHSGSVAQINHASLLVPAANLLTQYDQIDPSTFCDVTDIDHKCKTTYCECTQVLNAKLNEIIELVLVDEGLGSNQSHPMHIHGHAFRVLAQARKGDTISVDHVKQMDQDALIERDLTDPPLKDTVAVPDGGYTIVRFKASNPGWWMFHCHIQFHMSNGMMLAIRVGEEEDLPPTPDNFPTCDDWSFAPASGGGHAIVGAMMLFVVSSAVLLFGTLSI